MSDHQATRETPGEIAAFMSASEAAAALALSEETIRRAIRNGDLPATRQGRSFQIARADLEEFRQQRELPDLATLDHIAVVSLTEPVEPALAFDVERARRFALPAPLTPFVGRAKQLAALRDLMVRADVRLVTLAGPGGVGKTRLALQTAETVEVDFPDGVLYVPLAAVPDPEGIPASLMRSLDLPDNDATPASARIESALHDLRMLLILDNLEHLAGEPVGRFMANLLAACPGLKMLATSRILLNLSGEHAFVVPPLALPAPASSVALDELRQVEAIQLFVDRAQTAWPDFALSEENAADVAAICQRLDGLPLAIELAAARGAVLSPAELLARLDRRLPLLTGGPHDQPSRLRTMHHAIAWSYDLLGEATQARFRRLAVFSGGFSLGAAEAVGEGAGNSGHSASTGESPLDSLATLLTSSLLQRQDPLGMETRFGMLETVREFALDRLQAAGEEHAARAAHAAFFRDAMQQAEPELWAATSKSLLDRIDADHDNLRSALSWSIDHDQGTALRLVDGLGAFWSKRSHWREGRDWLRRVLETGAGEGSLERAIALGRRGAIASEQGDFDDARSDLEASLEIAEHLGATQVTARALRGLGIIASNQSDFARAGERFQGALEYFRALGDQPGISRSLNDLGLIADRQGDQDRAIRYQEEALPIARGIGDDWQVCIILGNLGGSYYDRGEFARGEALSQEALELARQLGDTFGVAVNLYNLGNCLVQLDDPIGAIGRYRESLTLTGELGERQLASRLLDRLGVALHQTGASRAGARLFGAAATVRESVGDTLFAEEDANLTMRFQEVRAGLGEAVYLAAWESGRSLPFERAAAEARSLADSALLAHQSAPAQALTGLSPREVEVLRLLADGHTDKDIAATLFISTRTASSHVAAIMAKLDVESRTAAVAAAFRRGLV
jgi:excisionase family DNA binding protein